MDAGASLLDALFDAVDLSPAKALARAPAALRRHGFHTLLAALPDTGGPGSVQPASETWYLTALRALAAGTRSIHIDLQTGRAAGEDFRFEYGAGPGGVAVPVPGFVLLPDPAWVRIRAGDVALELRGHPVAVITRPGVAFDHVRVVVYPHADLTDVVWPRIRSSGRAERVRAEGLDLWIGPDVSVCTCGDIYIRPTEP